MTGNPSSQGKRLLVTGSSGLIGTELVRTWIEERIHVVRLVRKNNSPGEDKPFQSTVLWDPKTAEGVDDPQQLGKIDAVVHLSGANVSGQRWTTAYKREILLSRVESTRALSSLIARLDPRPATLICASAIGIYGNRGDTRLDEGSSPGSGFLAETCVAWEAATRAAEAVGIRVVHARFGVVLSPKGGALAKLLPLYRLGLGGRLGSGRQWMPWITLRDVTGAMQHCLKEDSLRGAVNVVSPEPVTNAAFSRALGSALHRPAMLPAPAFALRLAIGQMADEALLASARVEPGKLLETGYRFADGEIAAALRSLISGS